MKFNLHFFAADTATGGTATPALITDAIYMEERSLTVMKGDVAELRDYDRTQANHLDSPKITQILRRHGHTVT